MGFARLSPSYSCYRLAIGPPCGSGQSLSIGPRRARGYAVASRVTQPDAGPADNDAMADDINLTVGSSVSSQLPVMGGFPNAIAVTCPANVAVAPATDTPPPVVAALLPTKMVLETVSVSAAFSSPKPPPELRV